MESLNRPSALLGNSFSMVPLILGMGSFRVSVVNFIWDCVERHSLLHEQHGDSSGKEADEDMMVHDAGMGGVTLEGQDVTFKRWGGFYVLLGHAVSRQPGDGIPGSILVFECFLELFKKVVPGFEGYGSTSDCIFLEGISPGQGRPSGHV